MPKGDFGYNGTIASKGIGTRRIRVVSLDFGLGIIASSDNEARSRRAFYPVVTTGSSFTMTVGFISWQERERISQWMKAYERAVAFGRAASGVMTIRCPVRKFIRTAVPDGDLDFGEGITDVGYLLTQSFIGASDPVNLDLTRRMAGISYFKGPKGAQESRYFYPAGRQVSGAEQLDGTTFDQTPTGGGGGGGAPAGFDPSENRDIEDDHPYDPSGGSGGL